jgi:hypothetical protein
MHLVQYTLQPIDVYICPKIIKSTFFLCRRSSVLAVLFTITFVLVLVVLIPILYKTRRYLASNRGNPEINLNNVPPALQMVGSSAGDFVPCCRGDAARDPSLRCLQAARLMYRRPLHPYNNTSLIHLFPSPAISLSYLKLLQLCAICFFFFHSVLRSWDKEHLMKWCPQQSTFVAAPPL